jgi:ClpP class serine protease
MKFVHILSRITGTPWLIEENALNGILTLLDSRIAGLAISPADVALRVSAGTTVANGVATIPVQGVIGKRLSPLEMACGGCDVDALQAAFDQANADPAISKIVLAIDSPGGTVTGVPELARHLYETKRKPLEAQSDTKIGSAAFWLACAADEIRVTPTTQVGSIGAASVVQETTGAPEKDGKRLRIFRSGADKLAGADGPLSKEQAAHIQARIDEIGATFRDFVTLARGPIPASAMTGLAYSGREAQRLGLCDHVVDTLSAGLTPKAA